MTNLKASVRRMWLDYLNSISESEEDTNKSYEAWYFGNTRAMADELGQLVKSGDKCGTTSLNYWYEEEGERRPEAGDINIITNYEGEAICIMMVKKITIKPFSEVDEAFAYVEGEGDKSLEYWRNEHIRFFSLSLEEENMKFDESMEVVCEEFEVIFG